MKPEDLELWHTGGGCTAWGHNFEGPGWIMVTEGQDPVAPADESKPVTLGIYSADGETWVTLHVPTLALFRRVWTEDEDMVLMLAMRDIAAALTDGTMTLSEETRDGSPLQRVIAAFEAEVEFIG